jgi:hypothetical protein
VSSTHSRAQTFTARLSGQLDPVALYLSGPFDQSAPLTVEITNVATDGTPGTTDLEGATVTSVPTVEGWVPV